MQTTADKLKDKKILIWGYGREGKSTEKFIKEHCSPASVEVYEGPRSGIQDDRYDLIFVSPGIPFEEDAPAFDNRRFTSQTELFLEEFGAQTVGITGTKGKSTTSSLLAHVLEACTGKKVYLIGNIGKPCFDHIADMDGDCIAVFELSCHQCQRLHADPHVAVFLDLYEDHLDRYHTMEHYFDAKCGITKIQTADDILYLGDEVPALTTKAQKRVVKRDGNYHFDLRLPGSHNQYNAEFVFRIATEVYGCREEDVRRAMAEFTGLPHRLQYAGTYNGVMYYDDSISTIPEATINAVNSIPETKTVLLGGMDRGIDYDILYSFIRAHRDITFILGYASGERIYAQVKDCPNVILVKDLKEQVAKAKEITPVGSAVVMSNAAASYGYFKNFEERGDYYQQLIRE
jgi:UDP-N-acetylmuramoylalanine--D-glutamate ligase